MCFSSLVVFSLASARRGAIGHRGTRLWSRMPTVSVDGRDFGYGSVASQVAGTWSSTEARSLVERRVAGMTRPGPMGSTLALLACLGSAGSFALRDPVVSPLVVLGFECARGEGADDRLGPESVEA